MENLSPPWSVSRGRNGAFSVVNRDDYPICRIVHWTPSSDEAAARLIAAAPELYDALEYMSDLFKDVAGDPTTETGWKTDEMLGVYEAARALLRKASGE